MNKICVCCIVVQTMEEFSCMTFVFYQKKYLTVLGVWPTEKANTFAKMRYTMVFCIAFGYVFSLVADIPNVLDNYQLFSEHIALIITDGAFLLKLITFTNNRSIFLKLLGHINHHTFTNHPKTLHFHMQNSRKHSNRLMFFYVTCCTLTILQIIVSPLFRGTPLPVRLAMDLKNFTPAVYAIQSVGIFIAATTNSTIDCLAVALMSLASAQLDILGENITKLSQNVDGDLRVKKDFLNNCARHHVNILEYVEWVEKSMSSVFLVQLLASIGSICNIGFQLVHVGFGVMELVNKLLWVFVG